MGEFVRLEVDGGIGTIRLDRPPVNALNAQLQTELWDAAQEAARREDIHAVIVYGGPKSFAGGADIKEMAELSYSEMASRANAISDALSAVADIPKPTVAAITGYALGGGMEIALAADRRVVADNVKLGPIVSEHRWIRRRRVASAITRQTRPGARTQRAAEEYIAVAQRASQLCLQTTAA